MDSKLQQEREVNGGTPFAEARGSEAPSQRRPNSEAVKLIYMRNGVVGICAHPCPTSVSWDSVDRNSVPPNAALCEVADKKRPD